MHLLEHPDVISSRADLEMAKRVCWIFGYSNLKWTAQEGTTATVYPTKPVNFIKNTITLQGG